MEEVLLNCPKALKGRGVVANSLVSKRQTSPYFYHWLFAFIIFPTLIGLTAFLIAFFTPNQGLSSAFMSAIPNLKLGVSALLSSLIGVMVGLMVMGIVWGIAKYYHRNTHPDTFKFFNNAFKHWKQDIITWNTEKHQDVKGFWYALRDCFEDNTFSSEELLYAFAISLEFWKHTAIYATHVQAKASACFYEHAPKAFISMGQSFLSEDQLMLVMRFILDTLQKVVSHYNENETDSRENAWFSISKIIEVDLKEKASAICGDQSFFHLLEVSARNETDRSVKETANRYVESAKIAYQTNCSAPLRSEDIATPGVIFSRTSNGIISYPINNGTIFSYN